MTAIEPNDITLPQRLSLHRERVQPIDVLVVDDQRQSRMLLETILQQMGHRPTACQHADRALDLLNQHPYALVLADYHMPGMNGLQMLEVLRHDHPEMPFILVTADDGALRQIEQGSNVHLLTKPVYPQMLCEKLESLFPRGE